MLDIMYKLSDVEIFVVLILVTLAISTITVLINKQFIWHRLSYKDNPTIGSIGGLIGIIYGVLAGIICLYLIDNNDHASNAVQQEATAAANIFRDSDRLKQPYQKMIQDDLHVYIDTVIKKEWPLMRDFKDVGQEGDVLIKKIFNDIKPYEPVTEAEKIILGDLYTEIKSLYAARHQRTYFSTTELSPELWEVIIIGTVLIIAINYAFRANLYLHLFGIVTFSVMASSMLFLLITLDRPFQGEFAVDPDAFEDVLKFVDGDAGHSH